MAAEDEDRGDYWNHNVHYHGVVLRNVPRGCGEALDVGCGDGLLVLALANDRGPGDRAFSALGVPAHHLLRLRHRRTAGDPGAPIADPGMTWGEVRDEALRPLPGTAFRRHLL
jgi:hypothetical protein